MFVNRGIYHRGWTAVTRHSTPWVMEALPPYDEDRWELYAPDDWTQAHDIAAEQPEQLAHLQRLFLIEAAKYNVLPLDDRRVERFNPDLAGRPQLIRGNRQLLFGGMTRLSENSVVVVKNKSFSVTADIVARDDAVHGTIISQGGAFGGWTLYAISGRPAFCYNLFGLQRFTVRGETPMTAGNHQVRVEFIYDGGGLGKGGLARLYLDGAPMGEGRVDATVPMAFSADETCDVGSDTATPVTDDLEEGRTAFTGRVGWVEIDISGGEDADHIISAEERMRVAMARQ
jgi:arylsulfatase